VGAYFDGDLRREEIDPVEEAERVDIRGWLDGALADR